MFFAFVVERALELHPAPFSLADPSASKDTPPQTHDYDAKRTQLAPQNPGQRVVFSEAIVARKRRLSDELCAEGSSPQLRPL